MAIAKHISITNRENLPQKSSVNPNVEKLLCGALYLVTKCCKPNDELIVSSVDKTITEIAVKNKDRTLPNWAINALQQDVPENSINIFAIYIKTLAISIGYSIYVNSTNTDGLKMRIYGNDN
jgi:hypothetical protein